MLICSSFALLFCLHAIPRLVTPFVACRNTISGSLLIRSQFQSKQELVACSLESRAVCICMSSHMFVMFVILIILYQYGQPLSHFFVIPRSDKVIQTTPIWQQEALQERNLDSQCIQHFYLLDPFAHTWNHLHKQIQYQFSTGRLGGWGRVSAGGMEAIKKQCERLRQAHVLSLLQQAKWHTPVFDCSQSVLEA